MSDIKEQIDTLTEVVNKAVAAGQEANDRNEVKQDILNDETFKRASKDAVDAIEKAQKLELEQKALNEKMKQIEAVVANFASTGEAKSESKEFESKAMREFIRKGSTDLMDEVKAMSVSSDPDGGYLVSSEMASFISERMFDDSPMRLVARVETVSSDSLKIALDDDELAAPKWQGETSPVTDTDTPDIGMIDIRVHEQVVEPRITQKLIDDASVNVEEWLSRKIADRLSRGENAAFINGDGVARPRGIITYPAWAVAGTYEQGAVEQVNSGSSGAVTGDGFKDIQGALKHQAFQSRAVWLMNSGVLTETMKLKDLDGQYLFGPTGRLDSDATNAPLLGKRVIIMQDMPDAGADSLSVAYGDFSAGYTIIDRIGIRIQRDPFTQKPFVKFYTTKRVGGDVTSYQAFKLLKLAA